MKVDRLVVYALAPLLLMSGCATARRGEPSGPPMVPRSEAAQRGQRVFAANCHECHPGGMAGIGPALNNKPLPGFMIKLQVRVGMGAMPSFSEQKIGDDALGDLVEYLKELRHAG